MLKAIVKTSAIAILLIIFVAAFIKAFDRAIAIEHDNAPRPSLQHLDDMCKQGFEDACEAYLDRVNEVTK